ncbi:YceI family protein [Chryseolinea sp. Jin1]|uniref:YceI family protein n=2 Tax=Chryseolinea lacunae TaxID=2801331 RepID=A0ABS1KXW6_9BACT|nr:YceI family protein [Chryseolinea lacunae]
MAQRYSAEKTFVSFFSKASVEDIKAENTKAVSMFDATSGEVAYSVPIKDFKFAKSLMQEHFNEKYLESEKYPKSTFEGKIVGFKGLVEGVQQVHAQGKLTIHGVTHDVDIPGTLEKQADRLVMKSKFMVKLEDYKVRIPQLFWKNIAEQVEVTIDFTYQPK